MKLEYSVFALLLQMLNVHLSLSTTVQCFLYRPIEVDTWLSDEYIVISVTSMGRRGCPMNVLISGGISRGG